MRGLPDLLAGNGRARMLWLVVQREMSMRLRSRTFRIVTVLMVVFTIVGLLFAQAQAGATKSTKVGFLGSAQSLAAPFAALSASLGDQMVISSVPDITTGLAAINDGTLDVLVSGDPAGPTATVKEKIDPVVVADLTATVRQGVFNGLLKADGLDPVAVESQVAGAGIAIDYQKPPSPDRTQQILVGFAVAYMLMFSLSFYGGLVAQGVIEEKSSRIVEIILSALPSDVLLAGKIIGIGLVGLIQLVILGVTGFAMVGVTGLATIPAVSAGALGLDLVWFVLGFYLYATLFAAGASLVSRQEEVASVTAPPISLLILAYLLVYQVVADPGSVTSTVLSFLPPFAPVLMTFRMAMGAVPAWQVALSMGLTALTAVGLTLLAGRIYANSVLRLGSRVSVREALGGRGR